MPFTIEEMTSPHRVVEQLGQGGMATGHNAYPAALDRCVAIKAPHPTYPQDPCVLARFEREARRRPGPNSGSETQIIDRGDHA